MATDAQTAANISNAQFSTGPRTEAGKAASSQNGITLGLFAANDFIRPCDQTVYAELTEQLQAELAPEGLLEHTLVDEIRRAMWRLRRCGEVEANFIIQLDIGTGLILDPMELHDIPIDKTQRSVDRARAQSHRLLHKSTAELRKLQTNRQCALQTEAKTDPALRIGLADVCAIAKAKSGTTKLKQNEPNYRNSMEKPSSTDRGVTTNALPTAMQINQLATAPVSMGDLLLNI